MNVPSRYVPSIPQTKWPRLEFFLWFTDGQTEWILMRESTRCVCDTLCLPSATKSKKKNFSVKAKLKVTWLLERTSLVEYACQISNFYLIQLKVITTDKQTDGQEDKTIFPRSFAFDPGHKNRLNNGVKLLMHMTVVHYSKGWHYKINSQTSELIANWCLIPLLMSDPHFIPHTDFMVYILYNTRRSSYLIIGLR